MSEMDSRYQQFFTIFLVALLFGIINAIGGWMITVDIEGGAGFPGFFSMEFWRSVVYMVILFLFTGICFFVISLLFPSYRKNRKEKLHKPIWTGVMVSGVFL